MSAASLLSGDTGAVGSSAPAAPPPGLNGAAPPAPTNLSAVNDAQTNAATSEWVNSIDNPAVKTYVQAKGWKSPGDLAEGYQNLEKLLSGEKVLLPKGEADTEGWNRFFKAAGRPETPDGYKLQVPEQGDTGFAKDAAQWFHAAGLSTKQAQLIAKNYTEYGAKIQQAQQAVIDARNTKELEVYKSEQGQLYEAKLELGRRAAKQFGFSNDELVAFERAFGTKTLLTRFAAIGEALGEHVVVGEGRGAVLAPTQAAAKIKMLKEDKEFVAQYTSGNADAKRMMRELSAAAAGMSIEDYETSLGENDRRRRP